MKRTLILLLLLAVSSPPGAFAGQLSEAETRLIQDCIDNVNPDKGVLSPEKADECVDKFNEDGGALLDKASADFPQMAVEAAARNNALSDLRDIIVKYDGRPMALALTRVLKERKVLPQMRLGPKPESLNGWVGKHLSSRVTPFKRGIRSWDILGDIRIQAMKTQTEASWAELVPADRENSNPDRYKTLYLMAREKTEELLKTAQVAAKKKGAAASYAPLVQVLKEDLAVFNDSARIAKLDKFMEDLGAGEAAAAKPAAPSAADKKAGEVQDAANRLKGAAGKEDAFLARTFDKAKEGTGDADGGVSIGGKGSKFTPVPITDDQAAQLGPKMGEVKNGKMTGALAEEMRGTKAGDEIISFFEDPKLAKTGANTLNLKFVKGSEADGTDTALGWYSSDDKVTRINTDVVDKFCASRKITPEQLLKDDAAMRDLATYIAPTFVHETAHHRQDAWNTSKGFNFLKWTDPNTGKVDKFSPYQMEMEAEAFGMNGAFTAEKAQKQGLSYLKKLDPIDRDDAERYLEDGVDGLRRQYHGNSYTGIDSIKGEAARQLSSASYTASRVQSLEAKAQQKGAALTPEEQQELAEGRQALKTRFRWYVDTLAKSKTDERKLLGWRDSIDPEGKVLSTIKMSLLPDQGEE